jgi:type I restriction enzyme S subunit
LVGSSIATNTELLSGNNVINNHLEQIAQTIFKSWFVDFEPFGGDIPNDWREGTFSEIVIATIGGDWGKDALTGNYSKEVYCIRGADIPDVSIGNKGKMPIRYILPKNFADKQLMVGDIVVEISGGSPSQSTGRCALITHSLLDRYDRGMICTNFCRTIKPLTGYAMFVYFYWKYLYSRNVMFSYENGTTGIKNLDIAGFLGNEPIVIPPLREACLFTETIGAFVDIIFANGLENETLAMIRDALLPRLLSGELSVADL